VGIHLRPNAVKALIFKLSDIRKNRVRGKFDIHPSFNLISFGDKKSGKKGYTKHKQYKK
jgi:hypothetical protein